MAELREAESIFEKGCVEMAESNLGVRRVRGISGRGARGKPIVFGLIKRGGKADTQVVENGSGKELFPD